MEKKATTEDQQLYDFLTSKNANPILTFGKEKIDILNIKSVSFVELSPIRLELIEEEINGPINNVKINSYAQKYASLIRSLQDYFDNRYSQFVDFLAERYSIPNISHSSGYLLCHYYFDDEDFEVIWSYRRYDYSQVKLFTGERIDIDEGKILSFKNDILPILKKIVEGGKKKDTFIRDMVGIAMEFTMPTLALEERDNRAFYSEGKLLYKQLSDALKDIENYSTLCNGGVKNRNALRQDFLAKAQGKKTLCVIDYLDNEKYYISGICGFDITKAKKRIVEEKERIDALVDQYNEYKKKSANSNDLGEKAVEYAIKWFCASYSEKIVTINADCESKYRLNSILLKNTELIDEAQEFDHILVCKAGIILIETKNWKGEIAIDSNGKWTRKTTSAEEAGGIESPGFQMRRHEVLIKSIFPEVPVYSILCFSNPSAIIKGVDYFKTYPIVMVDRLEPLLDEICAKGTLPDDEIDKIAEGINAYKVNQR